MWRGWFFFSKSMRSYNSLDSVATKLLSFHLPFMGFIYKSIKTINSLILKRTFKALTDSHPLSSEVMMLTGLRWTGRARTSGPQIWSYNDSKAGTLYIKIHTFWQARYTLHVTRMLFLDSGHTFPHSAAAARPLYLQKASSIIQRLYGKGTYATLRPKTIFAFGASLIPLCLIKL